MLAVTAVTVLVTEVVIAAVTVALALIEVI